MHQPSRLAGQATGMDSAQRGPRIIGAVCVQGVEGASRASGLDASSLHPTGVASALCPFEQRFHHWPGPPVPLVLRWSTITRLHRPPEGALLVVK